MIWKTIKEFENYEVSDQGQVRNKKTGRILKGSIKTKNSKFGYANIILYNKGKRRITLVHRLVAEAFIPNPNNYPQVNHKDENSLNNKASNLEWCTAKYNMNYGTYPQRTRERMIKNNPFKNKKHSLESRQKMSLLKLGKPSKQRKKVIINGVEYSSYTEAMQKLHLSTRAFYRLIKEEK